MNMNNIKRFANANSLQDFNVEIGSFLSSFFFGIAFKSYRSKNTAIDNRFHQSVVRRRNFRVKITVVDYQLSRWFEYIPKFMNFRNISIYIHIKICVVIQYHIGDDLTVRRHRSCILSKNLTHVQYYVHCSNKNRRIYSYKNYPISI